MPLLILAHALLWIALPSLLEGSIRLDVAEGAIGGREWQLAYLRHPPFTTWLIELARETGPLRYVAVYAISQCLVIGGVLAIGLLAYRMEQATTRLGTSALTVALSLASPAATYIPIQLNHNIGLLFSTGLVVWTAWEAFERATLARWLLFGLAVGFGLWTKYAIGLVILPLMLAFLAVPRWRRQLMGLGPWLAVAVAVLVIAPHAAFVLTHGATTLTFATRAVSPGILANLRYAAEFVLNAALFMAPMALVTCLAGGARTVGTRIGASLRPATTTRADIFRHAVAFGPVLVTVAAALLTGVKPRLLWLTPMIPCFALWWAHLALPAAGQLAERRAIRAIGAIASLLLLSYVGIRLGSPYLNRKPLYPDYDGPALARLAEDHWRANETLPLRYLVSFGQQKGRQAVGSLAFDLPSPRQAPIHVLEDASLATSPWIDPADLKRRGALVISPVPIAADATVLGLPVTKIQELSRQMVRGASQPEAKVWFGVVEPQ